MLRKLTPAALVLAAAVLLIPLWGQAARAADDSVIASGDILSVTVLGEPQLTKRVVVDALGKITLPMAEEVEVGGVTTGEAAVRLKNKLTKFIKNPQVTIEIAEAAKRQVIVTGAVKTPGIYEVAANARLTTALTLAGSYTPEADISKITVTRGPRRDTVINIDLNEFLSGRKPETDLVLQPGDLILVPEVGSTAGNVFVLGEVSQRGSFPLTQGMTLREAIAAAGGVTDLADTSKMTIKHKDDASGASVDWANIVLQVGDTIFVPAVEVLGAFTILGPVAKPGQYPVKRDMLITDALAVAGGTTERGNLSKVRITRGSGEKPETINCDIPKITAGQAKNVVVQANDVILVGERKSSKDKVRGGGLLLSLLYLIIH